MNWRLNEGRGECMYMLGYEDDGKATGISPSELSASIKTLRVMMEAVGAKIENMQVGGRLGTGSRGRGVFAKSCTEFMYYVPLHLATWTAVILSSEQSIFPCITYV